MRNNMFSTITPPIMMEFWDGSTDWSRKDTEAEEALSFLDNLRGGFVDGFIATKIKEKKESLKLNGISLKSIRGKDYKLEKADVDHLPKETQKSLLKLNLADIGSVHALDVEETEAFNYVATKLSNLVFSEISQDDVERIAEVGRYVSEENYKKAMIESGSSSLRDYVEDRETHYRELVKSMIDQLKTLDHLRAITEILCKRTPEHKEMVTTAITLFKNKYKDIDVQITSLENQLTAFNELEIDLTAQRVILDQKISTTRNMIDTYHNRVRVSLNRIKTIKSMKEGIAQEAWDGTLDPYANKKRFVKIANFALKMITKERW